MQTSGAIWIGDCIARNASGIDLIKERYSFRYAIWLRRFVEDLSVAIWGRVLINFLLTNHNTISKTLEGRPNTLTSDVAIDTAKAIYKMDALDA